MGINMGTELIIFGAGKSAADIYEWAVLAGYCPLFFVDNAPEKWGKMICGIEVKSPEALKVYNSTVVLCDSFWSEIETQLRRMKYRGNVIRLKQLKKEAVCRENAQIDLPFICCNREPGFVFDAYFPGMNWGGIESYTCIVAGGLEELGVRTQIICGLNKRFDRFANRCLHFDGGNELMTIKKMAKDIIDMLPCVFLTHGSIALYAAQLVKAMYPDKIRIAFVTHGDVAETYEVIRFWADRVDKIICISEKIQKEISGQAGIRKEQLLYRPNPIKIPAIEEKTDRLKEHGKVLKVGYAARLVKVEKRTHLLPEIMEECRKRKLNIEFNIAGEGECEEELLSYVSEHKLEYMVHMTGWIPPVEMTNFWKEQDIYLNISDFEGMSLTMLEAMACGAVPVVTNVSGVSDMIEDEKNGFIIPVDNWLSSVDKIENLEKNRELRQRAGSYNMNLIRKKCSEKDYAEWLIRTFNF